MEEVEWARRAVLAAGVKTVTSFVLRWNPQLETMKQLIDDGVLGDLIYAEGDYWNPVYETLADTWHISADLGGSAFITGGCHVVDAIRFLGDEIVEVTAYSRGPTRGVPFEFDPVVVASLRFESGAVGKVSAVLDAESPYIFNVRLFGTVGTLQNNRVFSPRHYPGSLDYWEFPTITPDTADVEHHPFAAEIAHFIECIDAGSESHASIHDTCRSMAVVFAIDASAKAGGQPVRIADVINEAAGVVS
jgi:predicted dehydrogenase